MEDLGPTSDIFFSFWLTFERADVLVNRIILFGDTAGVGGGLMEAAYTLTHRMHCDDDLARK